MLKFLRKLPSVVKWVLVCVLVGALAFLGGRFTAGKKVTDTTTSTTTTTSNTTSSSSSNNSSSSTSNSSSTSSAQVQVVYQNQATIRQDRDTDCTEDFDPATGRLVRRRCITKSSTTSTTSGTGSATGTTTGTTTSNTTGTTTTTHTTTTETGGGVGGSWRGLHVTGAASLDLLGGGKLTFTPSYGIGLSKDLIGPVSVGVAVFTDKSITASLGLELNKSWSVSGGVASRLNDPLKISYGGSVNYRLLGPVYIGVWGYSDKSAGISVSITIP